MLEHSHECTNTPPALLSRKRNKTRSSFLPISLGTASSRKMAFSQLVLTSLRHGGYIVALAVPSIIALAVGCDTLARRRRRRQQGEGDHGGRSGIYYGRVWHVRFKPTVHQFTYPVFYCLLDLDELERVDMPW